MGETKSEINMFVARASRLVEANARKLIVALGLHLGSGVTTRQIILSILISKERTMNKHTNIWKHMKYNMDGALKTNRPTLRKHT